MAQPEDIAALEIIIAATIVRHPKKERLAAIHSLQGLLTVLLLAEAEAA